VKTSIEVSDFEYKYEFPDDSTYNYWMNTYHLNPSPEKAVDGFKYFSRRDLFEKAYIAGMAFYLEVYGRNRFLIPHLIHDYSFQSFERKVPILVLLSYLNYKDPKFYSALPQREAQALRLARQQPLPDVEGEIDTGEELDFLWGRFWATAKYTTLKKLVGALELRSSIQPTAVFKDDSKLPADKREENRRNIVYGAIKWSMRSNVRNFDQVRSYLEYMSAHETFTEKIELDLEELLGEK